MHLKDLYIVATTHSLNTVKAQALIDIGMPRAVLWNTNLSKEVDSQAFIVSTLQKAYNDFVIEKLITYFGTEIVLDALDVYRDRVSEKLVQSVHHFIDNSLVSA